MITISIAQFFINIAGKKAGRDGAPAGPVPDSPKRPSLRMRAFGLLPKPVQTSLRDRKSATLKREALKRLANTAPHLLSDIGIVVRDLTEINDTPEAARIPALILVGRPGMATPTNGLGLAVI